MSPTAKALYAQLAKTLGVADVPADANGIVHLTVGEEGRVVLVPEDAYTLMLMAPVGALPDGADRGTLLWLMRRNFHDSPLAPFRIGCDKAGTLVVWGRMPMEGLSGETETFGSLTLSSNSTIDFGTGSGKLGGPAGDAWVAFALPER